jgi:PAS domain S-box-containing protein
MFCSLACAAVLVFAWIVLGRAHSLQETNLRGRGWRDIEVTTERLSGALRDAEAGQRGYLLTQDTTYLTPFEASGSRIRELGRTLEGLTSDLPEEREEARSINQLAEQQLQEQNESVDLARAGDREAALAIVKTDHEQQATERIASLCAALDETAARGLEQARAESDIARRNLTISVIGTTTLIVGLMLLLTYSLRRDARVIRDSAEQLAITLESIGDAVVTTDAGGNVTYLNPVAMALGRTGSPTTLTPFHKVFKLIDETTGGEVVNPILKVLTEGKTIGLENHTALLRSDGSQLSIEDSAAPLRDEQGMVRGVVFVFKDVSEGRRTENDLAAARAELEKSIMDLRASEEELKAADRQKDVFLATLAHELRNPVAPIRHAIKVLSTEGISDERQRWGRSVISRQAEHIARLLDDLLDSARITRGELTLRPARVALESIVTDALDVAQPLIERKGHALQVSLPQQPITLVADGIRLAQVLSNLLTNAAKYTDAGGRIALSVELTEDWLSICVEDTGVGLAPEAIPQIFRMFGQVHSTLNRAEGGLGIGLSLSNELIRLHGGIIEASSPGEGHGTRFLIRLPRAQAQVEQSAAPAHAPVAPKENAGGLVLVVDDNVDAAASLGMLMEMSGHEVLSAHTGEDALVTAIERKPQVVLIDIGLPGISGYEVAKRLRGLDWARSALLIALTGWGQDNDKALAVQAGFDHHLTKPADVDEIDRLVSSYLRERGQARPASQSRALTS